MKFTTVIANQKYWDLPVLLMITSLVFLPVLRHDFLYEWDDSWQIINSYTEAGWTKQNVWQVFTHFYMGQYSPIAQIFYIFLYSLFGYQPFWFHFSSLLMHLFSVVLVYITFRKMFLMSGRFKNKRLDTICFGTALIFAIHPLQVESVAWLSADKILIYGFFYLLATYTWLFFLERKKWYYYMLTILFFALSFGGKEQAVMFPVWLLLLQWFIGIPFKKVIGKIG